jgi:glycosyltransferase involved in cell wall biosynthesis
MKNIIIVSTFDTKGDGYTNYIAPIGNELVNRGYNIFGYGLSYSRGQHNWNFGVNHTDFAGLPSIIATITNNLEITAILVAMDVPQQIKFLTEWKNRKAPYVGIFAVEADPLSSTWAMNLMQMDRAFTISQFGADECNKVGIPAIHLPAVLDLSRLKYYNVEERKQLKTALGFGDKTVFFMNADGNERKNTALVYQALAEVKKTTDKFHFILLTRKNSPVSWDYDDLAQRFNLHGHVTILDRGLDYTEVNKLYAAADFTLNVTKAEGLGMAILESQASGTPVIATNVTGMKENISNGRGIAVEHDFMIVDIFGNGNRYYVNHEKLADILVDNITISQVNPNYYDEMTKLARASIESRNIINTVDILERELNGQTTA